MSLEVFVRCGPGEKRICLTRKGKLIQAVVERESHQDLSGGIYSGRVVTVEKSVDAAFVDIGLKEFGFLAAVDAHFFDHARDKPKSITELFTEGQKVLVQIVGEPIENKGPKVSTKLAFRSPNFVVNPGLPGLSISSSITDERERQRLVQLCEGIMLPGVGLTVGPGAAGVSSGKIIGEINGLLKCWRQTELTSKKNANIGMVFEAQSGAEKFFSKYSSTELKVILVEGANYLKSFRRWLHPKYPEMVNLLKVHNENWDIFNIYDLADQWEEMLSNKVELPSGGSIIIEETSALTAIDVNTGKTSQVRKREDANLEVNLEAIKEIVHQVMLRNLSGQIVIDFVPQKSRKNIKILKDMFEQCCLSGKVNLNIFGFTRLGLFEVTRQRSGQSISQKFFEFGKQAWLPEAVSMEVLYRLERELNCNPGKTYSVVTCSTVKKALDIGVAKIAREALEAQIFKKIEVEINIDYIFPNFSIVEVGG